MDSDEFFLMVGTAMIAAVLVAMLTRDSSRDHGCLQCEWRERDIRRYGHTHIQAADIAEAAAAAAAAPAKAKAK